MWKNDGFLRGLGFPVFGPEDETGTEADSSLADSNGATSPAPAEPSQKSLVGDTPQDSSTAPADSAEGSGADDPPKDVVPAPEPLTAEQLKFPEGMEILENYQTDFLTAINDQELSPVDRANKLVEIHSAVMKEAAEKLSESLVQQRDEWRSKAENDPVLGGEKLEATLKDVNRAVLTGLPDEAERQEWLQLFSDTGLADHPLSVKMFHGLSQFVKEGEPVSGTPNQGEKTQAQILYPSQGA